MRFLLLTLSLAACNGDELVSDSGDTGEPADTGLTGDTGTTTEATPQWCLDADGDAYPNRAACVTPNPSNSSYVEVADVSTYTTWDCDDNNASVSPGQSESVGNGIDDDCDYVIDEDPEVTRYYDYDLDGYGGEIVMTAPESSFDSSWVENSSDCDDFDAQVTLGETYVVDSDGDGYGDEDLSDYQVACEQPAGYVDNAEDCNDSSDEWYPGAAEDCSVDEDRDCDGISPFVDADGDSFAACEDCDDFAASVNPDADEVCNSIDDDCDERVDDNDSDVVDATTWYDDDDADGFGDPDDTVERCEAPESTVGNDEDCDDSDAEVSPDAREVCDRVDNDCDSRTDDADSDVEDQVTWYLDLDGDSYGSDSYTQDACYEPTATYGEYVEDGGDCDEGDDDVNPDASEVSGNTEDEDCDGTAE